MRGEQRGDKSRRPQLFQQHQRHEIHQRSVQPVNQEIDQVIPGGVGRVAEDGVVEEVRQGGQRAIEAADGLGPPVVFVKDQPQVRAIELAQARVIHDEELVIESESRVAERVGERQQQNNAQPKHHGEMADGAERGP